MRLKTSQSEARDALAAWRYENIVLTAQKSQIFKTVGVTAEINHILGTAKLCSSLGSLDLSGNFAGWSDSLARAGVHGASEGVAHSPHPWPLSIQRDPFSNFGWQGDYHW